MDLNGNLFYAKLEGTKGGLEREEQGRASDQVGLGWSEKSKDNQRRAE